jgi:hypothetical protein
MPKTAEEWRKHLKEDLGGDGVDVELTKDNLDTALRRAIQIWNRWRPILHWLDLGEIAGGTSYMTLQQDEAGISGVLDVHFTDSDQGPLAPMPNVQTLQLRWGRRGARIFFQRLIDMRRMERFSGTAPDWWWDSAERILYIYCPSRPVKAMALFCADRAKNGEDIRYDEEALFEELALGFTKVLAADILEQAGAVPGPQGEIGSNAQTWRERGEAMIEKVVEELKTSHRSFPPPKWIG